MRLAHVLAASFVGLVCAAPCANAQVNTPYTRLVDSSIRLPQVAPGSSRAFHGHDAGDAAQLFLAQFQEAPFRKEWEDAAKLGLRRAADAGARGTLLRKTFIEVPGTIPPFPLGKGVELVGVGMDAADACINGRCWERLAPLPPGARFTADSDFVWISIVPDKDGRAVLHEETYLATGAFESHAQLIAHNATLMEQKRNEAWGRRVEHDALLLAAYAPAEAHRDQAKKLLDSRKRAAAEYDRINQGLAREMERARNAAAARKMDAVLSQVLNLSARLALAASMLGAPLSASSGAQLSSALQAEEARSVARASGLTSVRDAQKAQLQDAEQQIRKMRQEIQFTMPPLH